jgi:hypothetical protein
MRKIKAAAIAACLTLLAVLGITAATTTPAQALNYSERCITTPAGVKTCVRVDWNGGSNIQVRYVNMRTPEGCGKLEDNGGRYAFLDVSTHRYEYHWGAQPCTTTAPIYDDCYCAGGRTLSVYTKQRINWSEDVTLRFTFSLYPNGSWTSSTGWNWVPGE